jgi:cell wall-associated NlpC family hydrolase
MSSLFRTLSALAFLPALSAAASSEDISRTIPPSAVIGVQEAMLTADYWIKRAPEADTVLLTSTEIAARSREALTSGPAMFDVASVGLRITRPQVLDWLKQSVSPFTTPPLDAAGKPVPRATMAAIHANIGVGAIPATQPARFGMAVRRAQLRIYPTALKAYPATDSADFEYFQGGTLFPGDAVVIVHRSVDRVWLLVQSWQGPAWVRAADIAEGSRDQVLTYRDRAPYRIITGDKVDTVFTPEAPTVSELQLDMGTRLPIAILPPDQPVNGEGPYASWTILLPIRATDGKLLFTPALLQKSRDSAPDYLPLTRANILTQAFKLLGERYGWGHLFNARDCSGLTSDVYRSMGVMLPAYSGAQGKSPAWRHQLFTAADSHEARMKAVMAADIGDLIVVPGHVQMIIGKVEGQPYIIQDVPWAIFRDGNGTLHRTKLNQVSVTPLLPLLFDDTHSYVDAMTSLVHVTAR